MKRRVCSWVSLTDSFLSPHNHVEEWRTASGELEIVCGDPDPVLRNEELWQRLLDAQKALRVAEAAVLEACSAEPLDAVERECGLEMGRLMNCDWNESDNRERFDACRKRLEKHAETA